MHIRTIAAVSILLVPLAGAANAGNFDNYEANLFENLYGGCSSTLSLHRSIEKKIRDCFSAMHSPDGTRLSPTAEERAAIYYQRGLLYHLSGKYELAIADYSSSIELRSAEGAYEARADAYEDLGQHDKASDDYAQAAKRQTDDPDVLAARCQIRALRGHPLDRALSECTAALAASPNDSDILATRCLVYYRMGNYATAVADCAKARTIRPRNPSALYIGGLAKLRLGDAASGNADIAAAVSAEFRVVDVYALYGVKQ